MKQLHTNDNYKILQVELSAGSSMPRHFVTSDSFIIVETGTAMLFFVDQTYELMPGAYMNIPAGEHHMLTVNDDFKAFIVMDRTCQIKFLEQESTVVN